MVTATLGNGTAVIEPGSKVGVAVAVGAVVGVAVLVGTKVWVAVGVAVGVAVTVTVGWGVSVGRRMLKCTRPSALPRRTGCYPRTHALRCGSSRISSHGHER